LTIGFSDGSKTSLLECQDGEGGAPQAGSSKEETKQKAARRAARETQKAEAEEERQRRAQLELLLMDERDLKDSSKIGTCTGAMTLTSQVS
jgi:hypothetical protein